MKTKFEIDATSVTHREGYDLIQDVMGAIETMIKSAGFNFTLSVTPDSNISYVIKDKPAKKVQTNGKAISR